jgi:ankyrin repeat protein
MVGLLCDAMRNGHHFAVRYLLEKGAEKDTRDKNGITPLIWGCLRQNSEKATYLVVRELVQAGADLEKTESGGDTPLMNAAWKGHLEVTRLLLQSGADPSRKNPYGKTAIDLVNGSCKENDWKEVIQLLKVS